MVAVRTATAVHAVARCCALVPLNFGSGRHESGGDHVVITRYDVYGSRGDMFIDGRRTAR